MIITLRDTGLSRELLAYGIHEPGATVVFSGLISPNDTIVEVGANIGYYVALEMTRLRGGRILAIEPDQRSRKVLEMNVASNASSAQVEIIPVALGKQVGYGELRMKQAFNLSIVRESPARDPSGRDLIRILPLDDILAGENKVDIVRMDIEGLEYQVIQGMKESLSRLEPRILFIELHSGATHRDAEDFFETLREHGYRTVIALPRGLVDSMLEMNRLMLACTAEVLAGGDIPASVPRTLAQHNFDVYARRLSTEEKAYSCFFFRD